MYPSSTPLQLISPSRQDLARKCCLHRRLRYELAAPEVAGSKLERVTLGMRLPQWRKKEPARRLFLHEAESTNRRVL